MVDGDAIFTDRSLIPDGHLRSIPGKVDDLLSVISSLSPHELLVARLPIPGRLARPLAKEGFFVLF